MFQEIYLEIKSNLKELKFTVKSLQHFAWLLAVAWLIIYWFKALIWSDQLFLLPPVILVITSFIWPKILKPFYWLWMALAFILGAIISRLILVIMFFGGLLPIRFLAQIFGVKFIDRSFRQDLPSYWQDRDVKGGSLEQPF